MIIPKFWAEARAQHSENGRQVTVRRFGWSNRDQSEAQTNADARAAEALAKILGGEKLPRHEPKVPYNGAEGVPIREEVVAEHGDCVITRNSYGALCLNSPDVLFAEVDLEEGPSGKLSCAGLLLLLLVSAGVGIGLKSTGTFIAVLVVGGIAGAFLLHVGYKLARRMAGDPLKVLKARLEALMVGSPGWRLRLYRTPAGFRILAMHQPLAPAAPSVAAFFKAVQADPVYVKMCQRQQCFRARVSPKPWRIGIHDHLRPRPGVWPVRAEAMPIRRAWIDAYNVKAAGFASCRFETELGQGVAHEKVRAVQQIHDKLSRADSGLPLPDSPP